MKACMRSGRIPMQEGGGSHRGAVQSHTLMPSEDKGDVRTRRPKSLGQEWYFPRNTYLVLLSK